jgi:hypothetical protein
MSVRDELKKLEDELQTIELWLYTHKKEVDEKRLEAYAILRRIADIREEEKKSLPVKTRIKQAY